MRLYCQRKEKSRHKALVRLRHFEWSSKGLNLPHWCLSYCSTIDTYLRSLRCFSGLTGSTLVLYFHMSDISQHSFYQWTQTMSDPQRCPIQRRHGHPEKEWLYLTHIQAKTKLLRRGETPWWRWRLRNYITLWQIHNGKQRHWLVNYWHLMTINGSQNSKGCIKLEACWILLFFPVEKTIRAGHHHMFWMLVLSKGHWSLNRFLN